MNASHPSADVPELTPVQLKQRLETGEPLVLIDVREVYEWEMGNLGPQGAQLIPLGELPERMSEFDREADIVLYCRSGNRSAGAARYLRAQGFENVWNLRDGILGWAEEVDPSLPT